MYLRFGGNGFQSEWSNKKCKLPEGSFKCVKRCYEEIHIPVPKQKPTSDGGLVPISSLSELVQQVYPVAKKLDRVQSKLYPIAYGTNLNQRDSSCADQVLLMIIGIYLHFASYSEPEVSKEITA